MARPNRLIRPGVPFHLVQRGHSRGITFGDDTDRSHFLEVVREASVRARVAIHAYVLMSNHVHLLATPADDEGPASVFRHIGRRYVRYFNRRYGRSGSLWEGRYHSACVDTMRYFLTCSRYIELNPVRAAMQLHPTMHRWSSYRCNADGVKDALVTPHSVYLALGPTDSERQAAYRALFAMHVDPVTTDQIRRATSNRGVLGPAALDEARAATERYERVAGPLLATRVLRSSHVGWSATSTF